MNEEKESALLLVPFYMERKMKRKDVLTIEDMKETTGLHFTIKHTGKMKGMQSLSTSCMENQFCLERSKNCNMVCSHCYAERQMKMYTPLQKCLKKNTEILTSMVLKDDELPLLNAAFFRFESFGDIGNVTQVVNYFNICKKNKKVNFALWTKNPWIIEKTIESGHKKPKNLQIVYSSPYINYTQYSMLEKPFIDKIFTVFDKDYIKKHDVEINCGDKCCLSCQKCYVKSSEQFINEKIK